jgi:hypothetical protein
MTRKDYQLIADAIKASQAQIEARYQAFKDAPNVEGQCLQFDMISHKAQLRGVRRTAAHLADALGKDNPRFDAGRFLTACGYGPITMNPSDPALDLRPLPAYVGQRFEVTR